MGFTNNKKGYLNKNGAMLFGQNLKEGTLFSVSMHFY